MLALIDCKRLLDIAFVAASNGFPGQAEVILDGLDKVWPDSAEVAICRAVKHYGINEFDKAQLCLGKALEADPGNEFALAHLGVVYHLAGEAAEARKCLQAVADEGNEPKARELAQALLRDVL